MDWRYHHSRAKLHTAIIALATEYHIDSISVGALAQMAELDRATIYNHDLTPLAVLEEVMESRLASTIESRITIEDFPTTPGPAPHSVLSPAHVFQATIDGILTHLSEHRALYRTQLDHEHPSLDPMLTRHLRTRLLEHIVPVVADPRSDRATEAAYVAAGTIAACRIWLLNGTNRAHLFATLDRVIPANAPYAAIHQYNA